MFEANQEVGKANEGFAFDFIRCTGRLKSSCLVPSHIAKATDIDRGSSQS